MRSTKEYQPLLKSLKTLKESGKVIFRIQGAMCNADENDPLEKQVVFSESECKIYFQINRSDTLDFLAEKAIRAEELMDELEWHLAHKMKSPNLFDFLYANLEL